MCVRDMSFVPIDRTLLSCFMYAHKSVSVLKTFLFMHSNVECCTGCAIYTCIMFAYNNYTYTCRNFIHVYTLYVTLYTRNYYYCSKKRYQDRILTYGHSLH